MNKKIIGAIIIGIVLAGIVITCIFGLNIGLKYREHKEIDIYIKQEFEDKDIKDIAKEVLGNREVIISKVEVYKDMVSIAVDNISDEELNNLNNKINEKYSLDNKIDDIVVSDVPREKLFDLTKPYIVPTIISFVIIELYLVIYVFVYKKYGKEVKDINTIKCVLELLAATIIIGLLYVSVLAITRLPVNRLTIPTGILILFVPSILKFVCPSKNELEKE